jgi:hypothetical protein
MIRAPARARVAQPLEAHPLKEESPMTTRTDYSAEQWQAIRNAPQLVALATAAAGNSGLFGSLSEGVSVASTIAAELKGDQPLMREIFAKDQLEVAQSEIRTSLKSITDKKALNTYLEDAATDAAMAAITALSAKGASTEADAYRRMLSGIGTKVANAATEGSFFGFGGERVSDGEKKFLARLESVVAGRA